MSTQPSMPVPDSLAPIEAALLDHLHAALDALGESIAGLGPDALNAAPGPDMNSLAVLVAHTVETARSIVHQLADDPIPRDREAAFRITAASEDELRAMLVACRAEIDALVGPAVSRPLDRPVSRYRVASQAWWLLQVLGHTREHAGHASLTRQLVERG